MNLIESFLLDTGLSWTMSKLLPYLITIALGISLVFLLKKKLANMNRPIRIVVKGIALLIPFFAYFGYAPIFQGDFSNNSTKFILTESEKELTGKKLVVLTIPGCPYCFQALGKMKKLKSRNDKIEIEYIVCHTDPETTKGYSNEGGKAVNVRLAIDVQSMATLAKGSFPTFTLVNNDSTIKVWSNDNFGVLAIDEVEELLK
jgi:hypothetical protein